MEERFFCERCGKEVFPEDQSLLVVNWQRTDEGDFGGDDAVFFCDDCSSLFHKMWESLIDD